MQRVFYVFLVLLLAGCADFAYNNDPLTGGIDSQSSSLAGIPMPAGWQFYPSHSYAEPGNAAQGLETWRSSMDPQAAAMSFFNTLSQGAWQLRLFLRKSDRILCLYQKDGEYLVLSFRKQGMLTILEIWAGTALPDGSLPVTQSALPADPLPEIVGEEFPAGTDPLPQVEEWGNSQVEEKILW